MALFTLRRLIRLLGVIAVCVLIWWLGPALVLFDTAPLAGVTTRVLVIVLLFTLWIAWETWRIWRAWRANRRLIERLVETEGLASLTAPSAQEEVQLLRERFEEAMNALRETRFGGRGGRTLFYELPWYIIIGPPGSGKTTLLRNSGLDFPLAERLGIDMVHGVGGTRNCDWWFTDEAALIDTAGRYSTQDVNQDLDRAAWQGFLGILRGARPRQPINGVILAISLAELIETDEAGRRVLATALRNRLQELIQTFRLRLPVYLVLTKADLIAGFREFFDHLDREGRAQVFGATLPLEQKPGELPTLVSETLQGAVNQIATLSFDRLHDEADLRRRTAILAFPQQVAAVRPVITGFMDEMLRSTRYSQAPLVRGVYLTSGTQEGTPIDRLAGAFARSYGFELQAPDADPAAAGLQTGKAFFIHRLLKDVLFAEAYLAGSTPNAWRLIWLRRAAMAGLVLVVLGLSALWYAAYEDTEERIATLSDRLDRYRSLALSTAGDRTIDSALPLLDTAKSMTTVFEDAGFSSIVSNLGLTVANSLSVEADRAYDRVLLSELLSRLMLRLERRLTDAVIAGVDARSAEQLRALLSIYLMMGDPQRFDAVVMRSNWVEGEAQALYALAPERRAELLAFYQDLEPLLPQAQTLNAGLVTRARRLLIDVPPADQVYSRLKEEAARDALVAPLDLTRVLGQRGLSVLLIGSNSARIPGLYTRDGFYRLFLRRTPELAASKYQNDWIIGETVAQESTAETGRIIQEVAKRYSTDYIRTWTRALETIGVRDFRTLETLVAAMEILSAADSPLLALFETLKRNTDLTKPSLEQARQDAAGGGVIGAAQAALEQGSAAFAVHALSGAGNGSWPGERIQQHFAAHRRLVDSDAGAGVRPIGTVMDRLASAYGALTAVNGAPDPNEAAYAQVRELFEGKRSDDISPLALIAIQQPEPLRSILRSLSVQSWGRLVGLTRDHVNRLWKQEVVPQCDALVANRYPIYADGQIATTLHDFGVFFGPSGVLDSFVRENLTPFIDDRTSAWRWRSASGVGLGLNSASLSQLQRGAEIGKAFFLEGSSTPAARFALTPYRLHPDAIRVRLDFSGETFDYRHEPPRTTVLMWPGANGDGSFKVSLTAIDGATYVREEQGPWALFRIIDQVGLITTGVNDRYFLRFDFDGIDATYLLEARSVVNPFRIDVLRQFRCPQSF